MLLAAHTSRAKTLTEWFDASVVDERDSFKRDPSLNLYHPDAPQPPYDPAFIARYREAQVARNRRITAWAQQLLADAKRRGETGFNLGL